MFSRWISGVSAAGVVGALVVLAQTQALGTVNLSQAVMADGKVLPAGTYQVRVTGEAPTPGIGQSPGGERWVEFLRDGTLAGREVASVIPASEIDAVAKSQRPKINSARVDVLKGGEYLRVWINRGTEHYLINMPPAP